MNERLNKAIGEKIKLFLDDWGITYHGEGIISMPPDIFLTFGKNIKHAVQEIDQRLAITAMTSLEFKSDYKIIKLILLNFDLIGNGNAEEK